MILTEPIPVIAPSKSAVRTHLIVELLRLSLLPLTEDHIYAH